METKEEVCLSRCLLKAGYHICEEKKGCQHDVQLMTGGE